VGALANEEVGKFLDRYFVSSFQRVGTFKIKNGQKQGGNVAAYFCAPDGRVLHAVAGPVKAEKFLEEARWVMRTTQDAIKAHPNDADRFRQFFRTQHALRLSEDYGVRVTAVMKSATVKDLETALAYRGKDGRRLAPILSVPPIENPREVRSELNSQAKVHQLLAAHACLKIEEVYGAVFQGILNERVSTLPVQADTPFPNRTVRTREKQGP
jgi:hypothetical protein